MTKAAPMKMNRNTGTWLDIAEVTPALTETWKIPSFQRPITHNKKLKEVAMQIGKDGVIPGVLTVGIFDGKHWIVDGNHRKTAFLSCDLPSAYAEVRYMTFTAMSDMAAEFKRLQQCIARMKPDDNLRAAEVNNPRLREIRRKCAFVGYGNIRRNGDGSGAFLSMSQLLRCLRFSSQAAPANAGGAADLADELTDSEVEVATGFLKCALAAWGGDHVYRRLWGALNLTMCLWLYRRIVLEPSSEKVTMCDDAVFTKLLMSLSADQRHLDWLVGRGLAEVNRSPAYRRIKDLFAPRLKLETGAKKVYLPAPAWASGQ